MIGLFGLLLLANPSPDIAIGEALYACKVSRGQYAFSSKPAEPDKCTQLVPAGSTWIPYFAAPDGTLFTFDEATAQANGDQRTVWSREDYTLNPKRLHLVERIAVQSFRVRIECRANTFQMLGVRAWNPKGVEVVNSDDSETAQLIVPSTPMAELARFVCSKPASFFRGY